MNHQGQTSLVPRSTITEIVALRNAAAAEWERFFDAIEAAHVHCRKARELVEAACGGNKFSPYAEHAAEVEEFNKSTALPDVAQLMRVALRLSDVAIWWSIVRRTELESLMDKKAKEDLRDQMRYIPERTEAKSGAVINQEEIAKGIPPVTEDHIMATLEGFRLQSDMIWKRGIAEAFTKLDRRFRSHDGFKIGNRLILSYAFSEWGDWSYSCHHNETLFDIERVFLILDGKKPTMPYASIVETVSHERGSGFGKRRSEHSGVYFKIRVFKNGNAHLWFKRKDLLDKVNRLLADYYGAGLGWGKAGQSDPDDLFAGAVQRAPAKEFGFFPTPDALADKVVEQADLCVDHPLDVLEPSAGTGSLAGRAAKPFVFNRWIKENREYEKVRVAHRVDVVEVQPSLVAGLRSSGYAAVYPRDFLAMSPNGKLYDRVIMNPPFDLDRDIDHVWHAMQFVKPGGRLVAVMSASTEWAESKKAKAFREQLLEHWKPVGGRFEKSYFEDLPERSFAEFGTNVNTVLVAITKRGKISMNEQTNREAETESSEKVERYVLAYTRPDGIRIMVHPCQGRFTDQSLQAVQQSSCVLFGVGPLLVPSDSLERIEEVYGPNPDFCIAKVPCYPSNFDPQSGWIRDDQVVYTFEPKEAGKRKPDLDFEAMDWLWETLLDLARRWRYLDTHRCPDAHGKSTQESLSALLEFSEDLSQVASKVRVWLDEAEEAKE